jgi:hypothetical protein
VDESIVTAMPLWSHAAYLLAMAAIGIYYSVRLLDKRIRQ